MDVQILAARRLLAAHQPYIMEQLRSKGKEPTEDELIVACLEHMENLEEEEDNKVLIWSPFEHYTTDAVLDEIDSLAVELEMMLNDQKKEIKQKLIKMAAEGRLPLDFNKLEL